MAQHRRDGRWRRQRNVAQVVAVVEAQLRLVVRAERANRRIGRVRHVLGRLEHQAGLAALVCQQVVIVERPRGQREENIGAEHRRGQRDIGRWEAHEGVGARVVGVAAAQEADAPSDVTSVRRGDVVARQGLNRLPRSGDRAIRPDAVGGREGRASGAVGHQPRCQRNDRGQTEFTRPQTVGGTRAVRRHRGQARHLAGLGRRSKAGALHVNALHWQAEHRSNKHSLFEDTINLNCSVGQIVLLGAHEGLADGDWPAAGA